MTSKRIAALVMLVFLLWTATACSSKPDGGPSTVPPSMTGTTQKTGTESTEGNPSEPGTPSDKKVQKKSIILNMRSALSPESGLPKWFYFYPAALPSRGTV